MINMSLTTHAIALGLLITPLNLFAREYAFSKQVDPGVLQNELRAKGFNVAYIECVQTSCKIVMPDTEKKNPAKIITDHVYVDPLAQRRKRTQELRDLLSKWEANAISQEEKDLLLKEVVRMLLGK